MEQNLTDVYPKLPQQAQVALLATYLLHITHQLFFNNRFTILILYNLCQQLLQWLPVQVLLL